jgi:hypothetical protein
MGIFAHPCLIAEGLTYFAKESGGVTLHASRNTNVGSGLTPYLLDLVFTVYSAHQLVEIGANNLALIGVKVRDYESNHFLFGGKIIGDALIEVNAHESKFLRDNHGCGLAQFSRLIG